MTYEEALAWLASVEGLGIKLGLHNVERLLSELGDPHRRFPSILISGTNGKGSVAAMLAAILRRTGRRTGLYTSPHLIRHEERIAVDGRPVSAAEFAGAVGAVHDAIRRLLDAGRLDAHPTHFETLTAAAFLRFAAAPIDVGVLEVGMGGRLDATNLARPILSIVTNVSLEHTAFLGETVGAIAAEKAGILPEGGLLLTAETHPDALAAFRRRAAEAGGRVVELREAASIEDHGGGRFSVRTARHDHRGLEVALTGPHQVGNAALAVTACDLLETIGVAVGEDAIRAGLREVAWPGRFQIVERRPRIVLDGAHNPAGCRALAAALDAFGAPPAATTVLFGVLRDKDHAEMLRALRPAALRFVLTRGGSARFRDPHTYADIARGAPPRGPAPDDAAGHADGADGTAAVGTEAVGGADADVPRDIRLSDDLEEGLAEASAITPPEGTIVACGSLYLVGEMLTILGLDPWAGGPPAA